MSRYLYPTQFRLIEEETANILIEYGAKISPIYSPPVPVEMVAERLLKLHCEIEKLGRFGRGVLGVLLSDQKRLLIDERCNDTQYNFTIAHEIGHWKLHVPRDSTIHFVDTLKTITPLLRSTSGKSQLEKVKKAEVEANQFAAALLIPQYLLFHAAKNFRVIDAEVIGELATSFNSSALTMIYRSYNLMTYREFVEENIREILSRVDLDSIIRLENRLRSQS